MTNPAPLIGIPELPIPEGGHAEWFEGEGGVRLRAALYPARAPRGSVVLSPGRTEPIEKYHEVISELQSRGLTVLAHDWRGQGLSDRLLRDRLKGHATGPEPFRSDYARLLAQFEDRLPRPWVQVGHSMGGALCLYILATGETRFAAAALSSPMLGIELGSVPKAAARALSATAVRLGLGGAYVPSRRQDPAEVTFESDRIAHDRERWDRFRALLSAESDLRLGHLTWGWLDFALSLTRWLSDAPEVEAIDIPVLVVASGDDDRVSAAASRSLTARLRHGRFVEVPTAWHEILMETDDLRAIWWEAFDSLLAEVTGSIAPNAEG